MAVFGQSVCTGAKVVVLGQSGFNRLDVVVFGESDCIRARVVVIG